MEKRRAEEKTRQEMAKSKIELITKEKSVDLNDWDYKTYFGDRYSHPKGEFETTEDYINRFKSMLNPNDIYYFEIVAKLSLYDADKEQYKLLVPTAMQVPIMCHDNWVHTNMNPELEKFSDSRGQFIAIPLERSIAIGTFGIRSPVLAAIYNKLSGMTNYGYELSYQDSDSDTLVLEIPLEDARTLDLRNNSVIARVGVKFSYGVGHVTSHLEQGAPSRPI